MEKNQNKLTLDGATCFSKSGHEIWLSGFYKDKLAEDEKGARTITEAFKNSLSELMAVLSTCNGNFVRCIKPREKLENSKLGYQGFYVLNQLKYTGMLATLQIRKLGYPKRLAHQYFYDTYRVLNPDIPANDHTALVEWIQQQDWAKEAHDDTTGEEPDVRIGTSKVLMRDDLERACQRKRVEILESSCVVVQAVYRASKYKSDYFEKREASYRMAEMVRGTLARLEYFEQKWLHLDSLSRSSLTVGLRAAMARHTPSYRRLP